MKIDWKAMTLQIDKNLASLPDENTLEKSLAKFMNKIDERLQDHAEGKDVLDIGMSFETLEALVDKDGVETGKRVLDETQTYYFLDANGMPCLSGKVVSDLFYQYYEEMIGNSNNAEKYKDINPENLLFKVTFHEEGASGGLLRRLLVKSTNTIYIASFESFKESFDSLTGVMEDVKVMESVEA